MKTAQILVDITKNLKDEINTSLLVVTHDEDFASKTDRVIHMADGEVISK